MSNILRKPVLIFMAAAFFTSTLFFLLYHYDNKYTYPASGTIQKSGYPQAAPIGQNGVLMLDGLLEDLPFLYLVDGWAFYQNKLLSPADFQSGQPIPDRYVYIGQYGGFELDNPTASPYGYATYRLNVFTGTDEQKRYTLELPEIFSAYTIWINGEPVHTSGVVSLEKESYQPAVFHSSVTFTASDRIDILIAVANYDHYYSGLFYPPALGNPDAVTSLLLSQLFCSALAFFAALIVGLFYLCIGRFVHNKQIAFVFGLLCFFYGISLSHTPVHFTMVTDTGFWYRLEDFCFYGMLLCLSYLYFLLCPWQNEKPSKTLAFISYLLLAVGALICLLCLFVPTGLNVDSLWLMAYSRFVNLYKISLVTYLLFISFLSFRQKQSYAPPLLVASVCFGISLGVDALVPLYEPIRFGWPTEVGGFFMMMILGLSITFDVIQSFRDRQALTMQNSILSLRSRHTETYLALQSEHYQMLSSGIEQAKKTNHDMRHQLAALKGFADKGDIKAILTYIEEILGHLPSESFPEVCKNHTVASVMRYYLAMARQNDIETDIVLNISESVGCIADYDLCIVLGNLLENAIEATNRMTEGKKTIQLRSTYQERYIVFIMANSFDGRVRKKDDDFYSLKHESTGEDKNIEGVGLASIRAIAEKYNGYADFRANENTFHSSVTLKYK